MTRPFDTGMYLVECHGIEMFPLAERSKVPCIEGGRDSHTGDLAILDRFADRRPLCNYGVATGCDAGGLVVIDLDVDDGKGEDGVATLHEWESEHGQLPECPIVTTPRGGMHLWYRVGSTVHNSTNPELGVDVRGEGGYVVGPGSVLDNGTYEWDVDIDDVPIPEADARVMEFIAYVQNGTTAGETKRERFKLPEVIRHGQRDETIFKLACSLQSLGYDDEQILNLCMATNDARCKPPLPDDVVAVKVRQATRYEKGENKANSGSVWSMLSKNSKGAPLQTASNCETVLTHDTRLAGRFKYDQMAYTKTVTLPLPWDGGSGTRPITDADYSAMLGFFERNYGLGQKAKIIDAVIAVSMQARYNPVADWLDGLEWDGKPRIDTLLSVFLGAEVNEYNAEVMRLFMRGAIARALIPGVKFDHMLVFKGPQGIGKSTFLWRLAQRPEWFDDNFNVIRGDEAKEKLRGRWIIELSELLALKKDADVEGVKAFVTSRVDSFRPAYGRETESRPRVCVMAGSTNNAAFLTDPTGNRRFLPVTCMVQEPTSDVTDDSCHPYFSQAWAEAYADWKAGNTSLKIPKSIAATAEEQRMLYTEDDPRIGQIAEYLEQRAREESEPHVCVAELWERVFDGRRSDLKRRTINELHDIMQTSIGGWVQCKTKQRCGVYGIQKCYVPTGSKTGAVAVQQRMKAV